MAQSANLRLVNDSQPSGENRWRWSVWLEGPNAELDRIKFVEYILHPTYRNPRRKIGDRNSKFLLESTGWGEFMVHARVVFADKSHVNLSHWLNLKHDEHARPTRARASERHGVFISHSLADQPLVSIIRRALVKEGFEPLLAEESAARDSLTDSLSHLLGEAGTVLEIIPEEPSSWTSYEIEQAVREQKRRPELRIIPILMSPRRPVRSETMAIKPLQFKDAHELANELPKYLAAFAKR